MMSEEKLKEYFLKEEIFNGFSDFSGYRVLGTFQSSPKYSTMMALQLTHLFHILRYQQLHVLQIMLYLLHHHKYQLI